MSFRTTQMTDSNHVRSNVLNMRSRNIRCLTASTMNEKTNGELCRSTCVLRYSEERFAIEQYDNKAVRTIRTMKTEIVFSFEH